MRYPILVFWNTVCAVTDKTRNIFRYSSVIFSKLFHKQVAGPTSVHRPCSQVNKGIFFYHLHRPSNDHSRSLVMALTKELTVRRCNVSVILHRFWDITTCSWIRSLMWPQIALNSSYGRAQ